MGSSPDINYPAQPSYGEGMADAMKAQMNMLLGTGEFEQTYSDAGFSGGRLEDILREVEAPLRQQTAQTDTDVLRQTLLGTEKKLQVQKDPNTGKYYIPTAEVVEGKSTDGGRYQMVMIQPGRDAIGETYDSSFYAGSWTDITLTPSKAGNEPEYAIIDTETGGITQRFGGEVINPPEKTNRRDPIVTKFDQEKPLVAVTAELNRLKEAVQNDPSSVSEKFNFENPYTGEPLEEGQTVTIREGDGMIDLLGDRRNALDPTTGLESDRMAGFDAEGNFLGLAALAEDIQRGNLSRQREADLADVERLSSRYQDVMADYKPETAAALSDAGDILQEQKNTLTGGGAITVPTDSTYGGDMEAGTMTAAQVGAAPDLTAGTSYNAAQVADPMKLTAATSYDPSASVTGDGYTATANLEGGNIGADSLRAALLADAESALSQGLTEREQASISNAARARSGMMGRTFDQSGTIAEAQALVAENNARRMQNRAFAGDTLGREADIQRSDLDRGLQANVRNQDALNRAAEFGASQNMQAQLANQAATNQALSQGLTAGLSQEALAAQQQQAKAMADATAANRASEFGVGSGMQQDALRAQLGQQTNLAQAELQQQANAFGADALQRANQVNQAQRQQANQFGTGATMDAQRLNEQLKQSGTLGYVDAATRLAALEDQQTLDPFRAILGNARGGSLQSGGQVFGQAGYGLNSGPQYLNPESGLGYISQRAANEASMYGAQLAADATRDAGMMNMIGGIGGSLIGLKKPF